MSVLTAGHGAEVAAAFGLGGVAVLAGPVAAGRMGSIWRLTTDRGRYAVKTADSPPVSAEVERDAAYQDAVHAAGVPMPAVVRTPTGAVLAQVDATPVRVYSWVDVLGRSRMLDPATVGRLVAAIHAVRVPASIPVDPWYYAPIGRPAWDDMLARLAAAEAPFTEGLARVVPDVVATEAFLTEPDDVQWCHQDLWADNVLRTPDGALTVLDWENCGPGSTSQELMVVLFEFGCGNPGRMRELYAAYLAAGGPGRVTSRADATMLIAQLGNIALVGCRRWLESTTDAQREDNAEWVAEVIDEPVTVDTIDAMIEAVARTIGAS